MISISCPILLLAAQVGGGWDEISGAFDSGGASEDFHGSSVVCIGDVNGDGVKDYAVGQPGFRAPDFGKVFAYSGADHSVIWSLYGANSPTRNELGSGLARYPDWNGNGTDEVLVRSRRWVTMYSASTGALILALNLGNDLIECADDPIVLLDDRNGDGWPEIAVGDSRWSSHNSNQGKGRVQIWDVRNQTLLSTFEGTINNGHFGTSISELDDLDFDGVADLAIGAPEEDNASGTDRAGRVHICSGASGTVLQTLDGFGSNRGFGRSLAKFRDWDGDGVEDLVVGSYGASNGAGRIRCYSTSSWSELWNLGSSLGVDPINFGATVLPIHDVNGDGIQELAVGAAPSYRSTQPPSNGWLFIISGSDRTQLAVIEGAKFDGLGLVLTSFPKTVGGADPVILAGMPHAGGYNAKGSGRHRMYEQSSFLESDVDTISVSAGGVAELTLNFPINAEGANYRVVASLTGTGPVVHGVEIPVSYDWLVHDTFLGILPGYWTNSLGGNLGADGMATGYVDIPANAYLGLAGQSLYLAAVAFADGSLPQVSSQSLLIHLVP